MPKRIPSIMRRQRAAAPERRSLGGSGPYGMSSLLPAPVMSGVAVTPETAMYCVPVFAAVNVISTDAANLPLRVIRSKKSGKEVVQTDPRHDLVYCEPNEDMTAINFWQAILAHILTWGSGYSEVVRDPNGYPTSLQLLNPKPSATWAERTKSGQLYYRADGGRTNLPSEDVVHVTGLSWDGVSGYSPIAQARQAVGLAIAAEQYGAGFFGNSAQPGGYLEHPGKLTPDGIRNLREGWENVHQGTTNAHRTAVLENGTKWNPTAVPPDKAQFLKTREFQVIEVARLYRLPPHKIGDYTHSHLANIEEANLDYLSTTLDPWLTRIKQEVNRKLFTSRERAHGLHVDHDTSSLLRGNAAARTTIYGKMAEHGALSPDEWREREGMNPIPDDAGKIYYIPVNMQALWAKMQNLLPPNGSVSSTTSTDTDGDAAVTGDAADTATEPGDTVGEMGDEE